MFVNTFQKTKTLSNAQFDGNLALQGERDLFMYYKETYGSISPLILTLI